MCYLTSATFKQSIPEVCRVMVDNETGGFTFVLIPTLLLGNLQIFHFRKGAFVIFF